MPCIDALTLINELALEGDEKRYKAKKLSLKTNSD